MKKKLFTEKEEFNHGEFKTIKAIQLLVNIRNNL